MHLFGLSSPGGYFHIRRLGGGGGGGLGPGIEFRGKSWGKVQSSSPNKRINLGSSVLLHYPDHKFPDITFLYPDINFIVNTSQFNTENFMFECLRVI